jgi:hypothetical protein
LREYSGAEYWRPHCSLDLQVHNDRAVDVSSASNASTQTYFGLSDRRVDPLLDAVREKGARPNRYTGEARKT